jgi:hypothetical protein
MAMDLIGPLLLTAWLSGADVLVTAGPPTTVDIVMVEVPPHEVWDPLARAVACWVHRHPVITANGPVEVEFREGRRLDSGAMDFRTFHHASVPAAALESCERETRPPDKPENVTLSPESSEPDPARG